MESLHQSEHESCRVIVLGEDRREILLVPHEARLQLPSVEIPRCQRLAENLTSALKSKWNCQAVCSFSLRDVFATDPYGNSYQVMECWNRSQKSANNTAWLPIYSLSQDSFQDTQDYAALRECLAECSFYAEDVNSPFARCGWFQEVQTWIAQVIRPLGLDLIGPFRQFNAAPSFSLIRLETVGPAVWFKAVGEPNRREFPITLNLAHFFTAYLPKIIAMRPDWNAWLSLEGEGTDLGAAREIGAWATAAATLARLQIESLGKVNHITASGARDLSTTALSVLVRPFFEVTAELMRQQTKIPPPILTEEELHHLEQRIQDCVGLLRDLAIPDALGHLDLNPGNVIVSETRCLFLDWAEAYVGNPFLSLEYLREQFRRSVSADSSLESQLVAQYCAHWEQVISAEAVAEALTVAPLLAVFAYAVGTDAWRNEKKLRDQRTAGFLRSLARRMNREAMQLSDRRTLCLN